MVAVKPAILATDLEDQPLAANGKTPPEWWPVESEEEAKARWEKILAALKIALRPEDPFFDEKNQTELNWLVGFTLPQENFEALADSPEGTPVTFYRFSKDDKPPGEPGLTGAQKAFSYAARSYDVSAQKIEFSDGEFTAEDALEMALFASTSPAMREKPVTLRGDDRERALLFLACQELGLAVNPDTKPDNIADYQAEFHQGMARRWGAAEAHSPDAHAANAAHPNDLSSEGEQAQNPGPKAGSEAETPSFTQRLNALSPQELAQRAEDEQPPVIASTIPWETLPGTFSWHAAAEGETPDEPDEKPGTNIVPVSDVKDEPLEAVGTEKPLHPPVLVGTEIVCDSNQNPPLDQKEPLELLAYNNNALRSLLEEGLIRDHLMEQQAAAHPPVVADEVVEAEIVDKGEQKSLPQGLHEETPLEIRAQQKKQHTPDETAVFKHEHPDALGAGKNLPTLVDIPAEEETAPPPAIEASGPTIPPVETDFKESGTPPKTPETQAAAVTRNPARDAVIIVPPPVKSAETPQATPPETQSPPTPSLVAGTDVPSENWPGKPEDTVLHGNKNDGTPLSSRGGLPDPKAGDLSDIKLPEVDGKEGSLTRRAWDKFSFVFGSEKRKKPTEPKGKSPNSGTKALPPTKNDI